PVAAQTGSSVAAQSDAQPGARPVGETAERLASDVPEWINDLMPARLRRPGPFNLLLWQWLALPIVALVSFVVSRALSALSHAGLSSAFNRTGTRWDDRLLRSIAPSFRLFWALVLARILVPLVGLGPMARGAVASLLAAGLVVAIAWSVWR